MCDFTDVRSDKTKQRTRAGELTISPKTSEAEWFRWLENIQDWCISRQLWWGHRCPAYFVRIEGREQDVREQRFVQLPHPLITPRERRPSTERTGSSEGLSRRPRNGRKFSPPAPASLLSRIMTSWIPGSHRACGHSQSWDGQTRYTHSRLFIERANGCVIDRLLTCILFTPQQSWKPGGTFCSFGWQGWCCWASN